MAKKYYEIVFAGYSSIEYARRDLAIMENKSGIVGEIRESEEDA